MHIIQVCLEFLLSILVFEYLKIKGKVQRCVTSLNKQSLQNSEGNGEPKCFNGDGVSTHWVPDLQVKIKLPLEDHLAMFKFWIQYLFFLY